MFLPALVFETGMGALAPMIALSGRGLGASVGMAGLVLALLGVGQILGDIPAGALAARVGDRRAMLIASGIALVTLLGCALADTLGASTPSLDASIRQVRMGALVIEAAPGTEVRVEQLRHEFWFGAALANQRLRGGPDSGTAGGPRARQEDLLDRVREALVGKRRGDQHRLALDLLARVAHLDR